MKLRIAAILFIAAFIIQGTLLNGIAIGGVTPNLILCFLISFTFFYENQNAIYLALIFGLISDFCFANIIGISSLGYLLVGFLLVKFSGILNKENILSPIILGTLGTFIFNLFYWFSSNMFTNHLKFTYFLQMQPLYIGYNIIVMILIYAVLINRVVKYRSDRYYR